MLNYEQIPPDLVERMEYERQTGTYARVAFDEKDAIRRLPNNKNSHLLSPFVQDCDKILYCPYFNRYSDKTQVFALYKNDDVSRRLLHVLLVSRIARTIGAALNLNLNLIEAMSLGHDIGHAPFAHSGERYLDEILCGRTGKHFCHNVQSVRVLDKIFPYNICLQTLVGIACHNGDLTFDEYHPKPLDTFAGFDALLGACETDKSNIEKLVPSTLEGCVVRFADIIAYLGKDRQDADRCGFLPENVYEPTGIGKVNAEIINNLEVNIITNSYGKPYIKMDKEHFDAMMKARAENYEKIYRPATREAHLESNIRPMMFRMYETFINDIKKDNRSSVIFKDHINYIKSIKYSQQISYDECDPDTIVADYISGMTDDYFVELYKHMFPDDNIEVVYKGYFD